MAGNPFYQNLDPEAAPGPVTPSTGPGSRGPAPYDIQAGDGEAGIAAAFDAANALTGAGVLYPMGPRQHEAQGLLESSQGFSAGGGTSGYDITAGWSGSWDNDVQPPALLETPIQGMGDYPGTMQDGIQTYGC